MDEKAVEATRRLYNSHASVSKDSRQARIERERGGAFELKDYHNCVKRQLLECFAEDAPALLDLCCGRGGDIRKWVDCNVKKVLGVDLSPIEIAEAKRRYSEVCAKRNATLQADFKVMGDLGTREVAWEEKFDVVTCMFAIHYFFVTEEAIRTFLRNAASALKPGGYFIATFPDGKEILKALHGRSSFDSSFLKLRKRWDGNPQCFGSAYEFAIVDTVTKAGTEAEDEPIGSLEYLVFFNTIKSLAKDYGLSPVVHYCDPDLDDLFVKQDQESEFKHFAPRFPNSDASLERASSMNVACVFFLEEQERPAKRAKT